MIKLKYHKNSALWEGGDCTGFTGYGILRIIDGDVFVDDERLLNSLSQFDGRKVMYEFVFPEEAEYEIDEKILPLVKALQARGIRTLGSCEGHGRGRAYVGFYAGTELPVPEGWLLENAGHPKVWRIVSKDDSTDTLIQQATEFYQ